MKHHLRATWFHPAAATLLIGIVTAGLVAARWHLPLLQVDLVTSSLALGASAVGAVAGHAIVTSPPSDQAGAAARTAWQLRVLPLCGLQAVAFLALLPTAARAGAELVLLRQLGLCTGVAVIASKLAGRPGAALPFLWSMSIVVADRDGSEIALLWRALYSATTTHHVAAMTLAILTVAFGAAASENGDPTGFGHRLARSRHHASMVRRRDKESQ